MASGMCYEVREHLKWGGVTIDPTDSMAIGEALSHWQSLANRGEFVTPPSLDSLDPYSMFEYGEAVKKAAYKAEGAKCPFGSVWVKYPDGEDGHSPEDTCDVVLKWDGTFKHGRLLKVTSMFTDGTLNGFRIEWDTATGQPSLSLRVERYLKYRLMDIWTGDIHLCVGEVHKHLAKGGLTIDPLDMLGVDEALSHWQSLVSRGEFVTPPNWYTLDPYSVFEYGMAVLEAAYKAEGTNRLLGAVCVTGPDGEIVDSPEDTCDVSLHWGSNTTPGQWLEATFPFEERELNPVSVEWDTATGKPSHQLGMERYLKYYIQDLWAEE